MDRRLLEVTSQYNALLEEYQTTQDLITKLIFKNAEHVENLKILHGDNRLKSIYLLDVVKFQNDTYLKISNLNIDLENFLTTQHLPRPYDYFEPPLWSTMCHPSPVSSRSSSIEPTPRNSPKKRLIHSPPNTPTELGPVKGPRQESPKHFKQVLIKKFLGCDDQPKTPISNWHLLAIQALKVNEIYTITHIETPSNFCVQINRNGLLIDLISYQLSLQYENSLCPFSSKSEAMQKIGWFCCVYVENVWYRAAVLEWTINGAGDNCMVLVQLIDWGVAKSLSYVKLRELPTIMYTIPSQAIPCRLAYLYPPGSTKTRLLSNWPSYSIKCFKDICGSLDRAFYKITHVNYSKENKRYEVVLMDWFEKKETKSVGCALVDIGLAVPIFKV